LLVLAVPAIAEEPGLVAGTSALVLVLFALESRAGLGAGLTALRMRLRHLWKTPGLKSGRWDSSRRPPASQRDRRPDRI
jgi:hypothetical protein